MPRFPEVNEPSPETLSPTRPPVLNERNCTCQWGNLGTGEGEGDGGDGDEDGASACSRTTLVDSNPSEAGEAYYSLSASLERHEEYLVQEGFELHDGVLPVTRDIQEFLARLEREMDGIERSRLNNDEMGDGAVPIRPFSRDFRTNSSNSMRNHPGSNGPRSILSSNTRSLHSLSPGPGLCTRADEVLAIRIEAQRVQRVQLEVKNYLTKSPLRLTPQRSNCRGLVASHLIVRDA